MEKKYKQIKPITINGGEVNDDKVRERCYWLENYGIDPNHFGGLFEEVFDMVPTDIGECSAFVAQVGMNINGAQTFQREHIAEMKFACIQHMKAFMALYEIFLLKQETWRRLSWAPDYENVEQEKYSVFFDEQQIIVWQELEKEHSLCFPREDIAWNFVEKHQKLIYGARDLL